jgi:hypothetical protein
MEDDDLMPTPEDLDFHGVTSRYSDIVGVVIDPMKVPERLRHLIPLAKHWSIGDDVERADMMWLTPYEELKALVLAVRPFRDDIWNWCSPHHTDAPVPDEVTLFDMLSQSAAEAEALHVEVED